MAIKMSANLSDVAYERFLEAIFDQKIQPGTFVSQQKLASILDVPVAPLRDALRILQTEGWLTIHARSGIELRSTDLELLRNSFQLRSVLERAAVRTFATSAPKEEIAEIRANHLAVYGSLEGKDITVESGRKFQSMDKAFHSTIMLSMRNVMISEMHERAQRFLYLVRLDKNFQSSATLVRTTMLEHIAILDCCANRDPEAAEQAMSLHLSGAMHRAMGLF